jgi:hypothetical protein
MLNLNCTKTAADFFSTIQKGKKTSPIEPAPHKTIAESNDPLACQWLVHAIKVKRKNVLIVMDYHSRFTITLSDLTKGDNTSFLNTFEHHLTVHIHEMMTSLNIDPQTIDTSLERYFHQHNRCAFYQRGDRSVQAHVNDVAWHFYSWADEMGEVPTEVDLISFDVFANQLLRKRKAEKDDFTPQHAFLHQWLKRYGEHSTAQADARIDSLRAKDRVDFAARYPELISPSECTDNNLPADAPIGVSNNVIELDAYRKNASA